jgi:hypothetical protein
MIGLDMAAKLSGMNGITLVNSQVKIQRFSL